MISPTICIGAHVSFPAQRINKRSMFLADARSTRRNLDVIPPLLPVAAPCAARIARRRIPPPPHLMHAATPFIRLRIHPGRGLTRRSKDLLIDGALTCLS